MRTTLIGRWLEKNSKTFVALLAAGATLAIAMLVDASSSPQVEQLGQMAIHRSAHKATALSDGRVLITGGRNTAGIVIADAEIFDSNTGESSAVAPMGTARVDHTATLLKDGRVLITGGSNATGTLNSAEIFDPSIGTFSAVSGRLNMARARHTATLLSSGKVLIAGGDVTPTLVDPNGTDVTGTAEIFDPTARTFGDLVLLQRSRSGHTATLFSNDTVWLVGGGNNTIESFSASTEAFTLSDTTMTAMRSGHDAIALSDTRLLFLGGDPDHTIDEFNPSTDVLTLKATMDGAQSSATLLVNGKVLVLRTDVVGLYAPDAVDQTTAFIPFDETSVPGSTTLQRRGQTATELSGDKKIIIAGGENAQNQPMLRIAAFNPARLWTDKDDYLPDEPVLLYGSGWKANENVYLYAVDSETEQWTYGSTATANVDGAFAIEPYFIVQMRHLGTTFDVTAVGAQSAMQADVKFTDAAKPTSAITFPTGGGSYNTAGWTAGASSQITGTASFASGSTNRKVDVSIKRSSTGLYWNGSAFSAASENFITATGTTAWNLSFPSSNFPADGTYVVHSLATDNNGQENGAGGVATFTFDNSGPTAPSTPVLHSGDNSGSNADTITNVNTPHFDGTAEANSTVKIFSDGVQVGSGPAGNNGSYSVQTSVLSDNGGSPHTITATATDVAGNASVPSGSSSVTIDTARPTVTINQASGQSDPTSTSPINFTVVFSEPVADFATGDVTVAGTAGGTKTATVTGSGTTYNVAVSGVTTSGTVIATIGQNAANDAATNGNTASTSTDNTVTYNAQAATTLSVSSASGNYGGTVNPSATLTSGGSGVNGKTVAFTLNGTSVGSATTNSSGVASLTNVSLSGINAGTYANGVGASFAGDSGFASSSGTNSLTVNSATPTATLGVTNSPQTYNGSAKSASVNVTTSSVPGTVANILTGGAATQTNAGTYAVTADFVPNDSNYKTLTGLSAGNFVIEQATPTATLAVSNSPQTYNSSAKSASVNITTSSVSGTVANVLTGGAASQTNAGTYAVTGDFVPNDTTNYKSLTGLSAGNFLIDQATPTATLAVSNSPKTYNGSGQAALVSVTTSSVPGAVANILTGGAATQTNAGTYAVTADFVPTDSNNYKTLAGLSAGDFEIARVHLTAAIIGNPTKPYNGNTTATLTSANFSLNGLVGSESFTLTQTSGTYNSKDVATAATVTATLSAADFTPGAGTLATNYTLPTTASGAGHITAVTLTASIIGDPTKPYNGGTDVTLTSANFSLNGLVGTEGFTVTQTSGTYNSKNVVTANMVTASLSAGDFMPGAGTLTGNYTLPATASGAGHIAAVTLTASIIADPTRPYNGNTDATLTSANFSLDGLINTESFTVTQTSGTYNSKDVVTANTVTANLAAGDFTAGAGTLSTNYSLPTTASGHGHITAVTLTASIVGDPTRPYNGTTTAVLTSANFSLTGLIGSENFTVTQISGTYNSKDVASANTVTATLGGGDFTTTGGALATNYVLPTTASGAGHITTATLTASITGDPTRPYNGNTNATLTSANFSLSGLASGEGFTVTQTVGTYNSKDVAAANTVTASLSAGQFTAGAGTLVTNYALPTTASGPGHITAVTVTASIIGNPTRKYSGNTDATLTSANFSLSGLIGIESFTVTQTGGTYNSKDVATANTVTANLSASDFMAAMGALATNYVLPAIASGPGHIVKADATVLVTPYTTANTTYDGHTHTAAVTSITGVNGETGNTVGMVDVSNTTHTNAGTYATDYYFFTGTANYNDIGNTTITDSIKQAPLPIKADDKTIILHAPLPQFTVTPTGLVNGETIAVLSGTLTFTPTTTPANAGTYDIVPSGLMSNNYMITFQKGTLTVKYSTSCIIFGDPTGVILQPINTDGSSVCKAGSTVPAKFRVGDANCNSIGTPGVVAAFNLIAKSSDPGAVLNEDVVSTTPDTTFRWDPTAQQWIFNMSTKGMKAGVKYMYQIGLNDSSSIVFSFALK